jgi:putative membrane protein
MCDKQVATVDFMNPPKSLLVFPAGLAQVETSSFTSPFVMQTETKKVVQFFKSWLICTFAVLVAVQVVHGIHFRDPGLLAPVLTALLLGILNAFIRPILVIFALPLLILTLGLFMLVINALMLCFVSWLMEPYFQVNTFGAAVLGALVISLVSGALNVLTGNSNARISVQRRPPPNKPDKDGNGPVIDV